MAELATVARPYAEALFRVAKSGDISVWTPLVNELAEISTREDLVAYVANPRVTRAQVSGLLFSLIKSDMPVEAKNFVEVLVEKGRVPLMPEIGIQFEALKNADEGSANALVTSAFELSDAQLSDLMSTLGKKFGKNLLPEVQVDSSLIGGVRVVVGDEVLDTSVRAKLQNMRDALV